MEKLNKILPTVTNKRALTPAASASQVLHAFDAKIAELFPSAGDAIVASQLKDAVLWVNVSHPSFAMELRSKEGRILSDLQTKFGSKKIQKIRTKNV